MAIATKGSDTPKTQRGPRVLALIFDFRSGRHSQCRVYTTQRRLGVAVALDGLDHAHHSHNAATCSTWAALILQGS